MDRVERQVPFGRDARLLNVEAGVGNGLKNIVKEAEPVSREAASQPFPNYDQLSVASLRARLRGLDLAQVRQALRYEKAHGSRSDVITMYERRIEKLREMGG